MKGSEVRRSFLEFFRERGHDIVPSASVIPPNDPTLLFTNAGMVPFKQIFLGNERRPIPRVVSSQKCLRISGKHNDLKDVGRDTYHHTFFEMLGNWSFGDYYKREAITWAWALLTGVWKLPKDKLWVTVYRFDEEAEQLWKGETDIDPDRVVRFDEKDNFWEMGEVGPCGPCSEIHIDRGPGACDRQHLAGHVCAINVGCARYIELWNLVFIQHNRQPGGDLVDLPEKHVDTGMGLERVAAVIQDVPGNYDTDLLRDVIRFTEDLAATPYGEDNERDVSFRVIADHARAVTFMIGDGVLPSNEGRGYALRRLLRRAARHGKQVGLDGKFLAKVADAVIDGMREAYPALDGEARRIRDTIAAEEDRFAETLSRGGAILEKEVARLREAAETALSGEAAFRLYDTYGFPLDLTEDVVRADGLTVDRGGFERHMAEQRTRAREAQKAADPSVDTGLVLRTARAIESCFAGSFVTSSESEVLAVFAEGREVAEVPKGAVATLIVAETPFYAEGGGQVGDHGIIETAGGDHFIVTDTKKRAVGGADGLVTAHVGRVERGALRRGDRVLLTLDGERREAVRRNHSGTHVLHAALREVLGPQVRQAGSLVSPERLRFDFTNKGPVSRADLERIEDLANQWLRENAEVADEEMPFDNAIARGAIAFFGDKYGDVVRVVQMGDFSTELCGGTHVARSGDIALLKVRSESGVAAGVRRIEALTGIGALDWVRSREGTLREIGEILKGSEEGAVERLQKVLTQQSELERKLSDALARLAGKQSTDLVSRAREMNGIRVLAEKVDNVDARGLRDMADRLRERIGTGVVVLGSQQGKKVLLLAAVTRDIAGKKASAGDIIKAIAPLVGGGGGGRPDFAQAGGGDPSRLEEALAKVYEVVA